MQKWHLSNCLYFPIWLLDTSKLWFWFRVFEIIYNISFDESNQLTSNAREVLKITKDIITNIVKRCPFEDQVMARFNTLINDYSVSMFHYYEELLNLQKQEIKDIYENPLRQFDDVTECYSSCLSLSDIKILCKLTISCNHE